MNAGSLVNMVIRMVLRKFISRGIDAGMDRMSRRGGGSGQDNPEAAARSRKQGRDMSRRAKQAMRVTRRMGRF